MVWRIHFTAEDLARTRVAASLGPFVETVLGMSMLRNPVRRPAAFGGWRERVRGQLTPEMKPLAALIPPGSRGVDLYTLTGPAATIDQGVEALLAVAGAKVRAELEFFGRACGLPGWAWDLADWRGEPRRQLAGSVRACYRTLVEPYWARVDAHLLAERAYRGRILLDGGIERLLTTLNPATIRWRPPTLEVRCSGEVDFRLGGRGLVLVPSLFVGEIPALLWDLADEGAPARLIFPTAHDLGACLRLWTGRQAEGGALAALVGRTRAAVLRRIADGCTTSELARSIGISAAAASQHAAVLREAGLVSTRRHGGAVLHVLTVLGTQLLDAP